MKPTFASATLALTLLTLCAAANAHDVVLPAGTLLQCTLDEPNFSSKTVAVGDPVVCHLHGITEFGQQAFPRGSYLVGHLEDDKEPGHFFGKGYLKLEFDRIGLPNGDLPLEAKVVATHGYKVDKDGKIDGKGHAVRDAVEWMLPPLWPWKVIMLPARGPRPTLKGETVLQLRLMDDVQVPQLAARTFGPGWHFFGNVQNDAYNDSADRPTLSIRGNVQTANTTVSAGVDVVRPGYVSYVTPDLTTTRLATSAGMPVFVLKTGTILAIANYQYQDSRITYTLSAGGGGVISTDDVDWNATTLVNNQRGVHMTLHGGRVIAEATPGL
jgi:hypothetical protein